MTNELDIYDEQAEFDFEEVKKTLESLRPPIEAKAPYAECWKCPLAKRPMVASIYVEDADLIAVGEAPGAQEVLHKQPFVGQSGQLLSACITAAGHDPTRISRTNTVLCRPEANATPDAAAVAACRPRLEHELSEQDTPIILALGTPAMQALGAIAGELPHTGEPFWLDITQFVPKWVLPIRHPAYVLRNPNECTTFYRGIKRAYRGPQEHPVKTQPELVVLEDFQQVSDFLAGIGEDEWLSYDVETDQVRWYDRPNRPGDTLLMLGFAKESDGYRKGYVIFKELLEEGRVRQLLTMFFELHTNTVAHNAKFDMTFLRKHDIWAKTGFDTILAHYALDENKGGHGLKILATEYFDVGDYEHNLVRKYLKSREDKYSKVPPMELAAYLAWDVCNTLALKAELEQELKHHGLWEWPFLNILMPGLEALTTVEMNGMRIDRSYLLKMQADLEESMDELAEQMRDVADDPDLNPNSSVRLQKIIYEDLGMPKLNEKHIKPTSTSKAAISKLLEKLKDQGREPPELIKLLQQYRRVAKILSTYVDPLLDLADVNDRVHSRFSLYGTETGRLTCTDPPLHTIPRPNDIYGRKLRSAFVAEPGNVLVIADFSQAELRTWAHVTQDPWLMQKIREGADIHNEVTIEMFETRDFTKEQRRVCKTFVFSFVYGGTEYSFSKMYQVPVNIAKGIVKKFTNLMPVAVQWRADQFRLMKRQGYVSSMFGRRRRFMFLNEQNLDEARKSSCNMPIQSAASDITLLALVELVKRGYKVVLTVHDSIVVEAAKEGAAETAAAIRKAMVDSAARWISDVPFAVDVEISERWSKF